MLEIVRHRPGPEKGYLGNPQQWRNSFRQKPIGVRASYVTHGQMQVWSEQVWLNTTFISRGSRSWDKLAVET